MLREQFLAQPDRSTGHRLGEFFAAIDPPVAFPGVGEGVPKIPSIERDDEDPHEETGIGLWVLLNELQFIDGDVRVFDPLNDPDGVDLGGRFAFIVPDYLNLDLIEEQEKIEEKKKQEEQDQDE